MKTYWLSCHKLTCVFDINCNNIIIDIAPVLRRFCGQHKDNLLNWVKFKWGDYLLKELSNE